MTGVVAVAASISAGTGLTWAQTASFPPCVNRFQAGVGGPATFTVPVWNKSWNPKTAPQAPSTTYGTAKSPTSITYVTHGGAAVTMYLFLPTHDPAGNAWTTKSAEKIPLVVDVHGGGFTAGTTPDKTYAMGFTQAGYAVASLNYRLAPILNSDGSVSGSLANTFPSGLQDIRCAMRFLRAKADASLVNINYDPDRIGIFGGSSGGNMVAMIGAALDYDTQAYGPNADHLDSADCPVGVPGDTKHILGAQAISAPARADLVISLSGNLVMNPSLSKPDTEDGSIWGSSENTMDVSDLVNYFGVGANQPKGPAFQIAYNNHNPGAWKDSKGRPYFETGFDVNADLGSGQIDGAGPMIAGAGTTIWGATLLTMSPSVSVHPYLSIVPGELQDLLTSADFSANATGSAMTDPVEYYQQAFPDHQLLANLKNTSSYSYKGVRYPNYNPPPFLIINGAEDLVVAPQTSADFFNEITGASVAAGSWVSVEGWMEAVIGNSPDLNVMTGAGISSADLGFLTIGVYWTGQILSQSPTGPVAEYYLLPDQGHVPVPFAAGYADPKLNDNAGSFSMNAVSCEILNNLWAYLGS